MRAADLIVAAQLGYASAQDEGAYEPNLLLQGFLDPSGIVDQVRNGRRFLVLGYKGAGKSAITEHFRLLASSDPCLFVEATVLSDLLYASFKEITRTLDDTDQPTAWSWLLLLALFQSLSQDQGASSVSDRDFQDALQRLRRLGLLRAPSLTHLGAPGSTLKGELRLPFIEVKLERSTLVKPEIPLLLQRLRALAGTFRSDSRHLLFVDGLDDILARVDIQLEVISALFDETTRLNALFASNDAPITIVLLCRTDLFERLPSSNKNKVRQDLAISLNWFRELDSVRTSGLVRLVNRKAAVTDPTVGDVFDRYFPRAIHGRDVRKYLLDFTRHTPRAFLQLLKYIQDSGGAEDVNELRVYAGVKRYAIEYFVPEIRDELSGSLTGAEIDAAIDLMGALRQGGFGFAHISAFAAEHAQYRALDLRRIFSRLFDCSAIGNVVVQRTSRYFIFKFRNPQATANLESTLVLHRAIRAALNLDFGMDSTLLPLNEERRSRTAVPKTAESPFHIGDASRPVPRMILRAAAAPRGSVPSLPRWTGQIPQFVDGPNPALSTEPRP